MTWTRTIQTGDLIGFHGPYLSKRHAERDAEDFNHDTPQGITWKVERHPGRIWRWRINGYRASETETKQPPYGGWGGRSWQHRGQKHKPASETEVP